MINRSHRELDNTDLQAVHKRQVFWQIIFPLAIFCVLIIAGMVWLIYASNQETNQSLTTKWSEISVIYLSIPLIVFSLVIILILGVLILGLSKGIQKTPSLFIIISYYLSIGFSFIRNISDRSVEPIIKIESWRAIVKKISRFPA